MFAAPEMEGERKHRILLVEDDPDTLRLMKRRLESAGYPVLACGNGLEAVAALRELGADIVVTDWAMPEMSGLELCRAVHELRDSQALGAIYLILITASSERTRVVEAFEAGADDFLHKPFDFDELLARLRAGERILKLHEEVRQRQLELSKYTAQLAGLNRRLERLANTDMLTGLPNRRQVLERLDEAWALAVRRNVPLSCLMLDVDHFKRTNDTYGHRGGDLVLQELARRVQALIRRYDVCGRFGGEEFLVICPQESVRSAVRLATRLREAIAATPVWCEGRRVDITVSIGVAERRAAHADPEALIGEADRMLYVAKSRGRNQVWHADEAGEAQHATAACGAEPPLPTVPVLTAADAATLDSE